MGGTLRALSIVLFSLVSAQAGYGATWFVAADGSDASGTGSEIQPWATITHALDNASGGDVILVGPGTYMGRVRLRGAFDPPVTVRAEPRYQARLRHSETVLTCYDGIGITVEGFDIAHSGPGAGPLVVHIQNLLDDGFVRDITLRDNILHDSYNNDILKVNNGARHVLVEGNVFYNQSGSDEHIDVNSVTDVIIQDNIFFNDFEGSGRVNGNNTSSYIVVKDSNGDSDGIVGSRDIVIRRNVFLNWEGSPGSNFILCGEDGNAYFEAIGVTIENNLLLGNASNVMRAAFGVKGCKDIFFTNNTVAGDLPSLAYAMRLNTEGANMPNENIVFVNNVWSDPTGTMGSTGNGDNDFSDTPIGETASFLLDTNLYWNGDEPIPTDANEFVNISDDSNALVGDPRFPAQDAIALPRWNPNAVQFDDGSTTIRQAFVRLATQYGRPAVHTPVTGAARNDFAPTDDLLGAPRGLAPSLGALEPVDAPDADVNQDGVVDAVDIQLVINAALGLPVTENTDLNGDMTTDAVDVQLVIIAVLGG